MDPAKDRSKIIGGSEIAAVMGLDKYTTPLKLWAVKTGQIPKDPDNEYMELGNELEDFVAKKFEKKSGKKVRRDTREFAHKQYPYMVAHIDQVGGRRRTARVQDRFRMTELPSSMDAVVEWRTGATSGNVVWGLAGICVADGESLDTAFATEQLFTADAAQGVAETKNSTATLTGVTIASCAAGETYMFELRRASDEAGDTINSDDVDLISLTFVKTNAQDPTNSSSRFAGMVCVGAAPLPSRSRRATAVPHTSLLDEGAEVIYRFTDGSGTQISDSSGNDRHWTIGSPGPSWQTDPPHISFTGAAAPTETITSSHGHKATDGDFTWIGLMRSPIVESGPGDQIYVFEGQYLFGGGSSSLIPPTSSGSFAVVIKNAEIHLNGLARSTAGVLNDEWWFFAIVVQANPANSTLRINETVSVGTPSASAMVEATGGLAAGSDGLIFWSSHDIAFFAQYGEAKSAAQLDALYAAIKAEFPSSITDDLP